MRVYGFGRSIMECPWCKLKDLLRRSKSDPYSAPLVIVLLSPQVNIFLSFLIDAAACLLAFSSAIMSRYAYIQCHWGCAHSVSEWAVLLQAMWPVSAGADAVLTKILSPSSDTANDILTPQVLQMANILAPHIL